MTEQGPRRFVGHLLDGILPAIVMLELVYVGQTHLRARSAKSVIAEKAQGDRPPPAAAPGPRATVECRHMENQYIARLDRP